MRILLRGEVDEIIGATLARGTARLLDFNRMTGQVIRALRERPFPVVAAVHGAAAGARAVLALTAGFRIAVRARVSPSSSPPWDCPAVTWVPPASCPVSSASADASTVIAETREEV